MRSRIKDTSWTMTGIDTQAEDRSLKKPGGIRRRIMVATGFCLVLIMALGLALRLEDLRDWKTHPERCIHEGEPILRSLDGYYYLGISAEMLDGTYQPRGVQRNRCLRHEHPNPPFYPLLPLLTVTLSRMSRLSLAWSANLLPALLGMLIALPLYSLGKLYHGRLCGLSSAFFGVTGIYYLYRSSFGWYDTDALNVTLALTLTCFLARFGLEQGRIRYLHLAFAALTCFLFILWWKPHAVALICIVPLTIAAGFYLYGVRGRETLIFGVAVILCGAALIILLTALDLPSLKWGVVRIGQLIQEGIHRELGYIIREGGGGYPNIGASISELQRPTFGFLVRSTSGNLPLFLVGTVGFILLVRRRPAVSLFLSVPLALGILSTFAGRRFLIFLCPFFALGAGHLAALFYEWFGRRDRRLGVMAMLVVLALNLPIISRGFEKTFWPRLTPDIIDGMKRASTLPEDAVIWAWWDQGLPLRYYSDRTTIADNMCFDNTFYLATPLADRNPRVAANFIHFYAAHGAWGLQKLANETGGLDQAMDVLREVYRRKPENSKTWLKQRGFKPVHYWLRLIYPVQHRPVYLFLDRTLADSAHWWYWIGSWNFERQQGIHPTFVLHYGCRKEGTKITGIGCSVDLQRGTYQGWNREHVLNRVEERVLGPVEVLPFDHRSDLFFEAHYPTERGALLSSDIGRSTFNALFVMNSYPKTWFKPVAMKNSRYQLFQVFGDQHPEIKSRASFPRLRKRK